MVSTYVVSDGDVVRRSRRCGCGYRWGTRERELVTREASEVVRVIEEIQGYLEELKGR